MCFMAQLNAQEVDEAKRIQDSIRIARYENQLQSPDSSFDSKLVFDIDSTFVQDTSKMVKASTQIAKKHKPRTAVWLSAILPGLGQAYNKKYWKIPIVYAGFGGLSYAVYYTATNYQQARKAYRLQVDDDPFTKGEYKGYSDPETLKAQRDFHKRNLTISGICMAVWYSLNLIDAAVDAHLFDFNMSDDLALHWEPTMVNPYPLQPMAMSYGLKLNLRLR